MSKQAGLPRHRLSIQCAKCGTEDKMGFLSLSADRTGQCWIELTCFGCGSNQLVQYDFVEAIANCAELDSRATDSAIATKKVIELASMTEAEFLRVVHVIDPSLESK